MTISIYLDLMKVMNEISLIYAEALATIDGVATLDAHVIVLLLDGKQKPSQIAAQVGRAATSFTPCIDKLEKLGLIERQADHTDRRAVYLVLTTEGREAALLCKAALDQAHQTAKEALQQTEMETSLRRFMLRYALPVTAPAVRPYERKPLVVKS